jgi:DNA polymerase (family 10)
MAANLTNREIADVFYAISDTMEVLGEDVFRTRAYKRAGDAIVDLALPLAALRARGELDDIPGVGKAITEKIGELIDTGQLQFYEKLRAKVPAGVLEMLRVPNVGPRTAGRLYSEFGIASLADLKAAAEAGKLDKVKGFGAKTVAAIIAGISAAEHRDKRTLMSDALRAAESLIDALRAASPDVRAASYAGSLRRARETIGDLDILAASDDPAATVRAFTTLPLVARVESSGAEKATVYLQNGLQADLIALPPRMWGSALQHFTGGKQHNIRFREMAIQRGLSFSEHGFRAIRKGAVVKPEADAEPGAVAATLQECATEEEVYAAVGLPYIPPEIRENAGEFEAAAAGTLQEVNSGPDRLDLDAPSVRRVLELGATLTINSDSHHPDNLPWIRLGVLTARRGWAEAARVANTWDVEKLLEWIKRDKMTR